MLDSVHIRRIINSKVAPQPRQLRGTEGIKRMTELFAYETEIDS